MAGESLDGRIIGVLINNDDLLRRRVTERELVISQRRLTVTCRGLMLENITRTEMYRDGFVVQERMTARKFIWKEPRYVIIQYYLAFAILE